MAHSHIYIYTKAESMKYSKKTCAPKRPPKLEENRRQQREGTKQKDQIHEKQTEYTARKTHTRKMAPQVPPQNEQIAEHKDTHRDIHIYMYI